MILQDAFKIVLKWYWLSSYAENQSQFGENREN